MEKKTRQKSKFLMILPIVCIVIVSVIGISIFSIYNINKSKNTDTKSSLKTVANTLIDEQKNNKDFIYQLRNSKSEDIYINKNGYILKDITESEINQKMYSNSFMKLFDYTITQEFNENDDKVESKSLEIANIIYETLKNNDLLVKTHQIIYMSENDIQLMMSGNKHAYLGDTKDLSTKMTYIKNIMEQNKNKEGNIYVQNVNKAYFSEKMN